MCINSSNHASRVGVAKAQAVQGEGTFRVFAFTSVLVLAVAMVVVLVISEASVERPTFEADFDFCCRLCFR